MILAWIVPLVLSVLILLAVIPTRSSPKHRSQTVLTLRDGVPDILPTCPTAVCFLSTSFSEETLQRILTHRQSRDATYDIFWCIDLEEGPLIQLHGHGVHLVDTPRAACKEDGFVGSVIHCLNRVSSRDKALHYFSSERARYSQVWMLEEDVLFEGMSSLSSIDQRFGEAFDLLARSHEVRTDVEGVPSDWHWSLVTDAIPSPWASSMICVVRVSRRLLRAVRAYAERRRRLLLDEALFNTLAMHHRLQIGIVPEFECVVWNAVFSPEVALQRGMFYHPVKDVAAHPLYRFEEEEGSSVRSGAETAFSFSI